MKLLVLLFLICLTAGPAMAASAGDYMGGSIDLGGSGTQVTVVTTVVTQATPAALPPATLPVTGSLLIITTPPGAAIIIDGIRQGVSPATIPNLAPGGHTLLVQINGYNDTTAPVTVIAGQTQAYSTVLEPTATGTPSWPLPTKTPGFASALALPALAAVLALKRVS
ncbi:MAG: PEGA domain-containing protein [Methanoregula sp.]|nr:PEGA domain-containing protein [Methanoregula sp.]